MNDTSQMDPQLLKARERWEQFFIKVLHGRRVVDYDVDGEGQVWVQLDNSQSVVILPRTIGLNDWPTLNEDGTLTNDGSLLAS